MGFSQPSHGARIRNRLAVARVCPNWQVFGHKIPYNALADFVRNPARNRVHNNMVDPEIKEIY